MTNTRGVQIFRENDLRSLGWCTSKTSCESDYPISCVLCPQSHLSERFVNKTRAQILRVMTSSAVGLMTRKSGGKVRTDVIRKYLRTYSIYVPKDALAGKDWKCSLNYLWCYISSQFFHKNVALE